MIGNEPNRDAGDEVDLARLCLLFEDELSRQKQVYAACCAQGEAARRNAIDDLEAHTATLVALMEDAFRGEEERLPVLERVVSQYDVPRENHTLTQLIDAVPYRWQVRLRDFQAKISDVISSTQDEVRNNQSYMMRASMQMQDALTTSLQTEERVAEGYSHDGTEPILPGQRPAVLNALG